jgi:hypothetical protein
MPYTIALQAIITDNDTDEEVARLARLYEVESLAKVTEVAAHLGKSLAVTVEGVELGLEPNT